MFPKELNNARVLYYTPSDTYGQIYYENSDIISDNVTYLAICKYDKDNCYYLFYCNENYEVVTDDLFYSVEECKKSADLFYKGNITWIESK